jgi:threonyl-tRNA synthetase
VVGAKEVEATALNIRTRAAGELGAIALTEVVERMMKAIATYSDF